MHPTSFELRAFGTPRLSPGRRRSVLHHLHAGCSSCLATLAPRLLPWLDDEPAAEARVTEPGRSDRTLQREYLRAAARATRAAIRDGSPAAALDSAPAVRAAMARIEAEGPAVISRLPRPQLGIPTIVALLHLTGTLGPRDPRLRLRLAELAHDLTATPGVDSSQDPRLPALRDRTAVEHANALRVAGSIAAAYGQLTAVADQRRSRGDFSPLDARWLEVQGLVLLDEWRTGAAGSVLAAASARYRRSGRRQDLARTLICRSSCAEYAGDYPAAVFHARTALRLLDPRTEPLLSAMAWHALALGFLRCGDPHQALAIFAEHRDFIVGQTGGKNAARAYRCQGEALFRAGDDDGASQAFATCAGLFAAIRQPYGVGIATFRRAAALERMGDPVQARQQVLAATETILRSAPNPEVQVAMMIVRSTCRLALASSTLRLDRIADFLDPAEFNPSIRLHSYLD